MKSLPSSPCMYFDYLNVLVFAAVGLVFVFANLIVASIVLYRRRGREEPTSPGRS